MGIRDRCVSFAGGVAAAQATMGGITLGNWRGRMGVVEEMAVAEELGLRAAGFLARLCGPSRLVHLMAQSSR